MTDVLVTGMDLKIARIRQQVSATDLAARMGVSRATVTNIEQRHGVKPEQAERYRAALATFPTLATPTDGQSAA